MNRAERITQFFVILGGALLAVAACNSEPPTAIDARFPSIMGVDAPGDDVSMSNRAGVITGCHAKSMQPIAGISYHLTQGACIGDICTWDYDPIDEITRINGELDVFAGTFWWQESYDASHWRVATRVSGTVAVLADGSESSSFTVTTTDTLGVDRVVTVDQERMGCDLTRTTTDADGQIFTLQGTFGDTFIYTETQIPRQWTNGPFPVEATGERTDLGVVHETFAAPWPPPVDEFWWNYSHTLTSDADGTTSVDFDQWGGEGWGRWGTCSWDIAGTESCSVTADVHDFYEYVDWTFDYAGDGGGVYTSCFYDETTDEWFWGDCQITFTSGACSVACPPGWYTPSCRSFLMEGPR